MCKIFYKIHFISVSGCSGRIHEFYYTSLNFYEDKRHFAVWALPWYYPPLVCQILGVSIAFITPIGYIFGISLLYRRWSFSCVCYHQIHGPVETSISIENSTHLRNCVRIYYLTLSGVAWGKFYSLLNKSYHGMAWHQMAHVCPRPGVLVPYV